MKTKIQLLIATLLAANTLASFWYGAWTDNLLPVEQASSSFSCANVNNIYLNQDNNNDGIPDAYLYLNNNFILNGAAHDYTAGQILMTSPGTKIQYYSPLPNMLYKINTANQASPLDSSTFWRASRVFPYNTPVRGIATTPNKVVFEKPADGDVNKNIVSFQYVYQYKYAINRAWPSASSYRYNQVPTMGYMSNTGLTYTTTLPNGNTKRQWDTNVQTHTSCKNYQLHRCGDSVKDTYDPNSWAVPFTGETCDDGPLNGTPWYCPASCGVAATNERCWDNILQPSGTPYNGDQNNISFEECDDGDLTWDNGDGLLNWDNIATSFCSTICLPNFAEEFSEVFVP